VPTNFSMNPLVNVCFGFGSGELVFDMACWFTVRLIRFDVSCLNRLNSGLCIAVIFLVDALWVKGVVS